MAIYLDIETLDFFEDAHIKALPREQKLAAMRFGCAVTCSDDDGFIEWREAEVGELYSYLMYGPQPMIGWNVMDFDWPIIGHNAKKVGWKADERRYAVYDILDIFAKIRGTTNRWYSLETIAQTNLGRGKLADGQRAAEWLRSDDPEQITKAFEYCRHDVQLTIDLHAILMRGEPLRLPPRAKRQELNEILWWLDGRTERLPDAMGDISTR